jgi:hypothetical protein
MRATMRSTDTAAFLARELFSSPGRRGVYNVVPSRAASGVVFLACAAFAAAACGRTDLDGFGRAAARADAALDLPRDAPADRRPDLPPPPKDAAADVCKPQPETCNGVDDDCNGAVDDGLPPIPCPEGGDRYCVAGAYSDCPRRCDVCVPGSKRTCITSFCTFWGSQACAADGRSFGACKETLAPPECQGVASQMQRSPQLEQCCIDNGFCCVDEFDLDHDGDRTEMLGRCESVVCGP